MPIAIGPYQVRETLRRGHALAYLCVDPRVDRIVEVHLVDINSAQREEFFRRARVLAGLKHPGIATLLDAGIDAEHAFLVLEPLDGDTMAQLIARRAPIELARKLAMIRDVCRALAFARQRGVTALDISPSNLWVGRDLSTIKIACLMPPLRESDSITRAGELPETYLSPESIAAIATDERSDVFVAGVVLYELVAYRRPFGDNAVASLHRIVHDPADPLPATQLEGVGPAQAVVDRALAKAPAARYPSLTAMAQDLEPVEITPALPMPSMSARVERVADAAPAMSTPDAPRALDENVQFTIFRPASLAPDRWHTMLAFAHLAEPRPDAPAGDPDPIEEVQRQARAILGGTDTHRQQTVDSLQAVPREGELAFVPSAEGVEFNPPSRSFRWTEDVHREEFRLRAGRALEGRVVHGRLAIFLGSIILAEIGLTLKVDARAAADRDDAVQDAARPYRRIFASYSHDDHAIVEEFSEYAKAMGDRYERDVIDLRSGEKWQPALERLIQRADVFQLFWSWNALESPYVQQEWRYALALNRRSFIRPVYWDEPLPARGDLPPAALLDLHFQPIRPRQRAASARTYREVATTATPPMTSAPAPRSRFRSSWRVIGPALAALVLISVLVPYTFMRGSGRSATQPSAGGSNPSPTGPSAPRDTAQLVATIRDARGRALPGVTVELMNPQTRQLVATAVTDSKGEVEFDNVPRQAYRLIATRGGFRRMQRNVTVDRPAHRFDMRLSRDSGRR